MLVTLKKGVDIYNNAVVKVQADEITNAEYLTIANDHAGDKNKLSALENVKKIIIKL